jgi:hypothetical protein
MSRACDPGVAVMKIARQLRQGASYGSPGYGEGVRGASVSAPTKLSKQLLGLDLYAGAGGLSFMGAWACGRGPPRHRLLTRPHFDWKSPAWRPFLPHPVRK